MERHMQRQLTDLANVCFVLQFSTYKQPCLCVRVTFPTMCVSLPTRIDHELILHRTTKQHKYEHDERVHRKPSLKQTVNC